MIKKKKLYDDMQFYKEIGGIIETLRGVAVTEYFHLQKRRESYDQFEGQLRKFFQMIKLKDFQHPFLGNNNTAQNFILITSDTGFLGKLNISVINRGLEQYRQGDTIVVVGKQGLRYIDSDLLGDGLKHLPGIKDDITYDYLEKITSYIIDNFLKEKLARTTVIYPHFISFTMQKIQQFQIFPCSFLFPEEEKEKTSDNNFLDFQEENIFEPSLKRVVERLVRIWVGQLLRVVCWESKLSEWAARVTLLERSSAEITETNKKLKHDYFRLLRELNNKGIREIFASRLTLAKEK
ncbi:MAG: F0F1 ATP synthase subunit gamma [Candidatus Omnitrophica bacterium]|nr:F0F1 ATP synthase subunit gamma [Candidatus Omnitrophota bacterium]